MTYTFSLNYLFYINILIIIILKFNYFTSGNVNVFIDDFASKNGLCNKYF